MNIDRIGLIRGLPAADYHADEALSNSMLSDMAKSPAHCYALHLAPRRPMRKQTDAMTTGSVTHTAILEPETLLTRYAVKTRGMSFATVTGKAWRDAQTMEIVQQDDMDAAVAMRSAMNRVSVLRDLLSYGVAESSAFWIDKATGIRCRARPDWLHMSGPNRAIVLDVKTISELTPESVSRSIANWGYHRQEAHYSNGLRACGIEVDEFVFGFVSSSYPFLAAAYVLDDETKQQGADEVAELVERFADCKERNDWPAFGDGYQLNGLPTWARRSSEIEVSYAD